MLVLGTILGGDDGPSIVMATFVRSYNLCAEKGCKNGTLHKNLLWGMCVVRGMLLARAVLRVGPLLCVESDPQGYSHTHPWDFVDLPSVWLSPLLPEVIERLRPSKIRQSRLLHSTLLSSDCSLDTFSKILGKVVQSRLSALPI